MTTTFVYALCEPDTTTVRYIGMTKNLKRRFKEHLKASSKISSHLGNWLSMILSQGKTPKMIVLREVDSDKGPEAEADFIRLARGCGMNLVNATDGGEGVVNPSPETNAKRSAALTLEIRAKMSADNSGANNPFFGEKHTPETRVKMSLLNSGERNPMFGRRGWKHTEETKAKMRKPKPDSHRQALSIIASKRTGSKNPFFGQKHTEASKRKIMETRLKNGGGKDPNVGSRRSEEAKANMSIAQLSRYQRERDAKGIK